MPPKLSVNGFKWINNKPNFHEKLIKSYNEESEKVVVEYLYLHLYFHKNFPFLAERIKTVKCRIIACSLYNK